MAEVHLLVQEIKEALPLTLAMPVLTRPKPGRHPLLAKRISLSKAPDEVRAGLFLYIDELDLSHRLSQDLDSPTGSYWHAIMHRREGDFSNSKYWLNRAGRHPFLATMPGFDPQRLVDECEKDLGENRFDLVKRQREEWSALMSAVLMSFGGP
jgi:hypothetical protein